MFFKVDVINKKQYEESNAYKEIKIVIPKDEEELKNDFKYLDLDYNNLSIQDTHIKECYIIDFGDEKLTNGFNNMINSMLENFEKEDGYTTPFQEIINLYTEIKKFDNTTMEKFLALVETEVYYIRNIKDLVEYTKKTKNYELLSDIKNYKELGEYLVNETGYFDDVSTLDAYIDYYKLAEDYSRTGCVHEGEFTKFGYLMKKEFVEEENNKKCNEDEDEIE